MTFRMLIGMLLLCLTTALSPVQAADWPMWRGARGDGHSTETGVPTRWSATENVVWKIEIPGKGHSSPIVSGDRVFVTTSLEPQDKRVLLCIDRKDGKVLWERVVLSSPLEKKHKLNSYASSTPATDGKLVYVSFFEQPKIVLAAYDFEGKEVWRQSPGTFSSVHGFCSSPVIYNDLVILNCDQDATAWVVAYERATGKERWRIDRANKTRSYCTPVVYEMAGRKQLVMSGSKSVTSYDPDTGKPIWWMAGPTEQMVASLVYTDGVLFVTGGFPEHHLLGIDPAGQGDVLKTHILWRDNKPVSYVPSPIAYEKWFYVVSDGGILGCFEAKTGKNLYTQRLGKHHSASAVAANGHLYFTSDAGETFVIKDGPELQIVAKNELGDECYASPAISYGQIFIRSLKYLWCIGAK